MKWLHKFYHWLKDSAITDYIESRDIHLNSEFSSPFNPMTYQTRQEDKHTKQIVWNKHVKPIIIWSIPCAIIGVPLAIALLVFLAPVILFILVVVGIPILIIIAIIYAILIW